MGQLTTASQSRCHAALLDVILTALTIIKPSELIGSQWYSVRLVQLVPRIGGAGLLRAMRFSTSIPTVILNWFSYIEGT